MEMNHPTSGFDSWDLSPELLELKEDEIHLWRLDLRLEQIDLTQFEATLSLDEKGRAQRFLFPHDRDRFVATRGVLRELLGKYVKRGAGHLEFDYGSYGKPALRQGLCERSVQFNVSQSHGVGLLAFALGRHVGVDIELVRADLASEEMAERYFAPQEVNELKKIPPSRQDEGFFLCWTRKEAYVKARGGGLSIPLKSFQVSLTPGEPERLQAADASRWSMRSIRPAPGYVGALVAEGRAMKLHHWDWRPVDDR
jgi:4'-phosphopantetheinyl transferase